MEGGSISIDDFDESFTEFEEENVTNQRKLTSVVWNDFKRVRRGKEVVAVCRHCNVSFVGNAGTSSLRNHLKRKHKELVDDSESSLIPKTYKFDQVSSRKDLATMVIKHNYPLSIVDHKWFKIYSHGLNPDFNIHSRNTLRSDIINIYKEEKQKVYAFFESVSSKITLTTDIWTSNHQNLAYTCLTAHFIDENWELNNKILAYRYIAYPHDGETLFKFVRDLILEWNIDKKLFAMVVDNALSNNVMVRKLKSWLQERSLLCLDGDLFHVRCSAHVLNLIVQDGLKVIQGTIEKIRHTIRYLRNSTYAKQNFDNAVDQVGLKGPKILPIDVPHRWNSTYTMLKVTISMREALDRLVDLDENYKFIPSDEEWKVATRIEECLNEFYKATKHFSGQNFPTSNVFFPDVSALQRNIDKWVKSEHAYLREIAGPMKLKFDKYWDKCCLVLAIGVMFDPRFKLKIVKYHYTILYDEKDAKPYIKRVTKAFSKLHQKYSATYSEINDLEMIYSNVREDDKFNDFDEWCNEEDPNNGESEQQTSEVETYLNEPLFPRVNDFSVLDWWKINATKYPILARIARDVLAVQATSVASESAFSVGGRMVDETRSSMVPELVEALITTKDWIE